MQDGDGEGRINMFWSTVRVESVDCVLLVIHLLMSFAALLKREYS